MSTHALPCVVVAGGGGYLGSHMVRMLRESGWRAVVVDNLATGHADAVDADALRTDDIGDAAFMRALLRAIPVRDDPPREGDPPVLVAAVKRAREELGWVPQYPAIETIIAHAWRREQKSAR
jgi:UDP-glucose 4-epimerase